MPDFDITIPNVGDLVPAPQGTILVRVLNASLDTGFMAVMNDMAGSTVGMGPLAQEGGTDFYSAQLPAGNLPTSAPAPGFNNRTVMVEGLVGSTPQGNSVTHAFRAWTGSGLGAMDVAAGGSTPQQSSAPLPALLLVQSDEPAGPGARPAEPGLTLVHAQDPAFDGCWFSAPIDLRPGQAAGFWMLRRSGATWTLLLWCGGVLVMYQQPAADAAADRLPLTLARAGAATSAWPRAVTVVPAP